MIKFLALALVAAGLAVALDLAAWLEARRVWVEEWRRRWEREVT